jgi:hypothetical protein
LGISSRLIWGNGQFSSCILFSIEKYTNPWHLYRIFFCGQTWCKTKISPSYMAVWIEIWDNNNAIDASL